MTERVGEGKVYQTLQYMSRIAVWTYFRNLKVICHAPIPAEGPLLVAGNHMNMVLDPAMLIATFPHSRPCHFWALARFFKIPVIGQIFSSAGVLPVDTKTHSNAKLFESTMNCLEKGGVIAIFPEGTSYTAPHHLPFKDGLSWATYEYLSQQTDKGIPDPSISIIPVGITYSTKNKWRSDVIVEYGVPILVTGDDYREFQKDAKNSVKQLTERIAQGVERSTINSPDWDTANAAFEAKAVLFGDARGVRLEEYVRVSQSFINIFHPDRCNDDQDTYHEARNDLKQKLLIFHDNLRRLRLSSLDIRMYENKEITFFRALLRWVSTWSALVIQLPLFLPGIVVNLPIYLLSRMVNSFEKYKESVAQDKLAVSLILAMPLYSTIVYYIWKALASGFVGFIVALLLIPLFAWYHIALIDKRYDMLKQVIASWRVLMAVGSSVLSDGKHAPQRQELEDAAHLRQWCLDNIKSLLLDLAHSGDPNASYLVEYGKPLFEPVTPAATS
ncbi:hypothetical protein J3Q64DRAFT_1652843 [Phycomyces blakesleeanus]|uniref:Phospholipid/glycerol acyltransferase domain-containing protein n=2 Tax=Phycomyces blakesleeanus TaxID=4837 RepID=A0A167QHR4_PHYB8|nr:hypothetical protein PHYBLDRAFT_130126 [Phycomyces blakesleeanus NRRL 1555(-)]OAD79714.1 hypothetical protein PHYBLDRAFT_130126 [Phycomyces blakesleeanus NRRL 1555(-)]|eukprot:XP_018297754.1 hypothetical protein PHYBLDRAFT_130126 [Phycomyces blakesleeanus NRRL 1555(-)]